MSLTPTRVHLASSAKGYHNRVMAYAHRRNKARYLPPKNPHVRSPLANKMPEEYGNTWDVRSGVSWYYRMRRRNHFRCWPWARWEDDPVRQHEEVTSYRTVSAASTGTNAGYPLWDYYAEVGQAYRTPSHFPLTFVAPFIYLHTGKVWSRSKLEEHIQAIQRGTGLITIEQAAVGADKLLQWGERQTEGVPLGLLHHVVLVTQDVVRQNEKKSFREKEHNTGILRTADMERYYALPYTSQSAMPVKLAQPSGRYPWGRYTYMDRIQVDPIQTVDARYKQNMYPA